jgi:hypothetical protein
VTRDQTSVLRLPLCAESQREGRPRNAPEQMIQVRTSKVIVLAEIIKKGETHITAGSKEHRHICSSKRRARASIMWSTWALIFHDRSISTARSYWL